MIDITEEQYKALCNEMQALLRSRAFEPSLMFCWTDEHYNDLVESVPIDDPRVRHYNFFGALRITCMRLFNVRSALLVSYKGQPVKVYLAERYYTSIQQAAIDFFEKERP